VLVCEDLCDALHAHFIRIYAFPSVGRITLAIPTVGIGERRMWYIGNKKADP